MNLRTAVIAAILSLLIAGGWWLLPVAPLVPELSEAQKAERYKFLSEVDVQCPPMPPVTMVPTTTATGIGLMLHPDELVIGIEINGEARAYPLNTINSVDRKVMNDEVGGEPILITWCDLCHTAAAFSRKIDGKVELFGCSGMLWHGMIVMHDVRTESFWNPLIGKSVAGIRSGESLQPIDAPLTSWSNWTTAHPKSSVVMGERVFTAFTTGYYETSQPAGEWVFGVKDSTGAHAWSLDYLRAHPVIDTKIDGRPAVVMYDPTGITARVYSTALDGQMLTFQASERTIEDQQSKSHWNILTGKAVSGPLYGKTLTPIPAVWSFEKFWLDLLPGATVEHGSEEVVAPAGQAAD